MGTYAHCINCDEPMSSPTDREYVADDWSCPQCGHAHTIMDPDLRDEAMGRLYDKVEELDAAMKVWHSQRSPSEHDSLKQAFEHGKAASGQGISDNPYVRIGIFDSRADAWNHGRASATQGY